MRNVAASPAPNIEHCILLIRGHRVILDADLARLYGVTTKVLNQAVKRNQRRFPGDFLFLLTQQEKEEVVTNCDHLYKVKYSNRLPYAFTEHGAIMAATILNSDRAVEVSVYVVRAFVKLRTLIATHADILAKLTTLEQHVAQHDTHIRTIFQTIRELMTPTRPPPKRRIGFAVEKER